MINGKKHILVTGSNGFIGRRLVDTLVKSGHIVEEFDLHHGNIIDFSFSFIELDHIIHLASRVNVPESWEDPYSFYNTNVMGTVNILELCRKIACPLTYISSYVYGNPKYLPVDELHPVEPSSPYHHSKLIAEEICLYYQNTFHIPVTIFRPVNVYGPGQSSGFLIPSIINQVLNPSVKKITVMDLRPRRDYLYIDDFIHAIIPSLNLDGFNLFNIGSGISFSVEEIILTVMKLTDISKEYDSRHIERKNEIWDVFIDTSKIEATTGWKPNISFQEGIKRCVNYFKL